ncbi:hypothetical protein [Shewanella marina]|uniref:hypothetical protein n=1 Tax=Shewanella marina TaxID=487319 RepID=UPI0004709A4F|nr:hypothetical protein [Shewanella marina]
MKVSDILILFLQFLFTITFVMMSNYISAANYDVYSDTEYRDYYKSQAKKGSLTLDEFEVLKKKSEEWVENRDVRRINYFKYWLKNLLCMILYFVFCIGNVDFK